MLDLEKLQNYTEKLSTVAVFFSFNFTLWVPILICIPWERAANNELMVYLQKIQNSTKKLFTVSVFFSLNFIQCWFPKNVVYLFKVPCSYKPKKVCHHTMLLILNLISCTRRGSCKEWLSDRKKYRILQRNYSLLQLSFLPISRSVFLNKQRYILYWERELQVTS